MTTNRTLVFDAIYEAGVLRPVEALPLGINERVTVRIDLLPAAKCEWPDDTDEIYKELAAEELALANAMFDGVRKTWPKDDAV
jgi:predicted DNA-binding antitoxin AbrB/MazE fold protein